MPGYESTSNPSLLDDNAQNMNSPLQGSAPGRNSLNWNNQNRVGPPPLVSPLTNTLVAVLRQQMDDSNHELVNLLTNQMGYVINHVMQESVETNR